MRPPTSVASTASARARSTGGKPIPALFSGKKRAHADDDIDYEMPMSSPSERKIKDIKKSTVKTENVPVVQFTATNADANKKSSAKTEDVPRKKMKTTHDDVEVNFGVSKYLDKSAKLALREADRTGKILRAIGASLDEAEKAFMAPGQEADHAEFTRVVQVFGEYLNMDIEHKTEAEMEMMAAEPILLENFSLPDSETLRESDSSTSDASSEDSASEKAVSEASENESGSDSKNKAASAQKSGSGENDSGSAASSSDEESSSENESGSDSKNKAASAQKSGSGENDSGSAASSSDDESSSDSESDSDAEMVDAVQELPVAPVPATKGAMKPTKVSQDPVKAIKAPERTPIKVRGKTMKKQQPEVVQKPGIQIPTWLVQKPATDEPAAKAAPTAKPQPSKTAGETKAPTARKGYMEPPLRVPPPADFKPHIERGTGLNTIDHGPWGVKPTIQVTKEPVKRVNKVAKAPLKVPPTPDWHKKDATTTPQAAKVGQPIRQSTTPIPLPKNIQDLMKASVKPIQPAQPKASQAAPTKLAKAAQPKASQGAPAKPAEAAQPKASQGAPAKPDEAAQPKASQGAPAKPAEAAQPKASQGAPAKPAEPVETKNAEAAAPKASKSKKKKGKKSRASKKSEEVAPAIAKKAIIPKAAGSSDDEPSPMEIVKIQTLPAPTQPKKRKSPHRGPAYYDMFSMSDPDEDSDAN